MVGLLTTLFIKSIPFLDKERTMSPTLEQIIGRAMINKGFRDALLADPEAALKDAGLTLKDDELKLLKKTLNDFKTQTTSDVVDDHLTAGGIHAQGW
jgi:hypothetical protein